MSQYLIDIDEKVMDVAFKPEIVRDRYVKAGLTSSKSCLPSLDTVLKTCLRELSDDERMPIDENFILFLQKKNNDSRGGIMARCGCICSRPSLRWATCL